MSVPEIQMGTEPIFKRKATERISYAEVVYFFQKNGYKVLTPEIEYQNSRQKLNTICPNGHSYLVGFDLFYKRGFRCPTCSGNKRHTIESVTEIFKKEGYTLLSKEYKKNILPLSVQCPNGHIWETNLNRFSSHGIRCPQCSGHVFKYTHEFVKSTLLSHGYVLKSEYVNANIKMDTICPNGHEYSMRFGAFYCDGDRCPKCSVAGTSKLEMEFLEWVKNFYPNADKKRVNFGKIDREFDIFIPEINLAIELNGEYWHSEAVGMHKRYRSFEKMNLAKSIGWDLINVFCNEWINKRSQVMNLLLSKFGVYEHRVFARKCEVKEIDQKTCDGFLEDTHIQGKVKSLVRLGLYYNNELVAVMTGSKHHRINSRSGSLVLSRFSVASGYSIPGGASKLLSALIKIAKKFGYTKIVSWSDNRFSNGNVYKKLGFTLEEELKPDYFYLKNGAIKSKQSCQKKNLLKLGGVGKTEREMALSLRLTRVWDCGKIRWTMDI